MFNFWGKNQNVYKTPPEMIQGDKLIGVFELEVM